MTVVGIDGHLWPCHGDRRHVAADQLFAVVLVWSADNQPPWVGWLSTIDHRSARFSSPELDDPAFQRWLAALPGWTPGKLSHALALPGMHLVWRRPPQLDS